MAVLIHRTMRFGDTDQELKTYQPAGAISKNERMRADRLDQLLAKRIPEIADEIASDPMCNSNLVRRWFMLGVRFREIVEDRNFVLQEDLDNGLVWQAISYYLPQSMLPERSNLDKSYADKQHKRQDHFSLCYELSKFSWEEMGWIQRWADVHEIAARPALLRDARVFVALGKQIAGLPRYPGNIEFREIMKLLAQEFPTRSYRESLLLSDEEITKRVNKAVDQIVHFE